MENKRSQRINKRTQRLWQTDGDFMVEKVFCIIIFKGPDNRKWESQGLEASSEAKNKIIA